MTIKGKNRTKFMSFGVDLDHYNDGLNRNRTKSLLKKS